MDVNEIMRNAIGTSAAVELMNELVLATLQSSRETCVEMREMLEAQRSSVGHLTDVEVVDWQTVVLDIASLDRVIDYYGG
jgi:hypothetical protein